MIEYPNLYLQTALKHNISSVNKVLSKEELDNIGYLPVHINDIDVNEYKFIQASSMNPTYGRILVEDKNCIHKSWIDIPVTSLDLHVGYHLYAMQFISRYTKSVIKLYFSYTIQDNDPDKPYLYLKN